MSISDNSQTQTISSVTETAATATILGRSLVEDANGGGVFPNYSVTCSYDTTMFQVDGDNNKVHIIQKGLDPHTFVLEPYELYTLYMIPLTATINGQAVETSLGELLCSQVDLIIQARKLAEVITANPASQVIASGESVAPAISLDLDALVYVNYSIAWYQDGVLIPGATTPEMTPVVVTASTTFQAKVTTPFGVATSDIAMITIE